MTVTGNHISDEKEVWKLSHLPLTK